MIDEDKLAMDESRRIAQHEAVKGAVRNEVHGEIARHAERLDEHDRARAAVVGERLKEKAVAEVADTETELERARGVARISQVVDYIFYLIYGIISLEIILELMGAREGNAFRAFVEAISSPFLAPFKSLIPDPGVGRFQFRLSYIVALIVYILLHLAINGLLRLLAHKKTAV